MSTPLEESVPLRMKFVRGNRFVENVLRMLVNMQFFEWLLEQALPISADGRWMRLCCILLVGKNRHLTGIKDVAFCDVWC